ncbi:MAG: hypothetical protein ABR866_00760, partial [Candidatus Korobacteraceae bacterium]
QTPAAADGSLDKSACFDDGESGKCSLINAAGCLKIVDKFRKQKTNSSFTMQWFALPAFVAVYNC